MTDSIFFFRVQNAPPSPSLPGLCARLGQRLDEATEQEGRVYLFSAGPGGGGGSRRRRRLARVVRPTAERFGRASRGTPGARRGPACGMSRALAYALWDGECPGRAQASPPGSEALSAQLFSTSTVTPLRWRAPAEALGRHGVPRAQYPTLDICVVFDRNHRGCGPDSGGWDDAAGG